MHSSTMYVPFNQPRRLSSRLLLVSRRPQNRPRNRTFLHSCASRVFCFIATQSLPVPTARYFEFQILVHHRRGVVAYVCCLGLYANYVEILWSIPLLIPAIQRPANTHTRYAKPLANQQQQSHHGRGFTTCCSQWELRRPAFLPPPSQPVSLGRNREAPLFCLSRVSLDSLQIRWTE